MFKNLKNYIIAKNLNEAVRLLNKGLRSKIIAGGTSLFLFENDNINTLIDITRLKLNYIFKKNGHLKIGSTVTFNEIAISVLLQKFAGGILSEAASSCAYNNIRNLATIGGNIASSLSSADLSCALLALDAKLKIKGEREKIVDLDKFFLGDKKNILKKEIIVEIIIPAKYKKAKFIKFSRTKNDIAIINCACLIGIKNNIVQKINLAYGCCAPAPIRIYKLEQFLQGKTLIKKNIQKALDIIDKNIKPISDHRATAQYRKEIAKELFLRIIGSFVNKLHRKLNNLVTEENMWIM